MPAIPFFETGKCLPLFMLSNVSISISLYSPISYLNGKHVNYSSSSFYVTVFRFAFSKINLLFFLYFFVRVAFIFVFLRILNAFFSLIYPMMNFVMSSSCSFISFLNSTLIVINNSISKKHFFHLHFVIVMDFCFHNL